VKVRLNKGAAYLLDFRAWHVGPIAFGAASFLGIARLLRGEGLAEFFSLEESARYHEKTIRKPLDAPQTHHVPQGRLDPNG
jgi:hypothetical protein